MLALLLFSPSLSCVQYHDLWEVSRLNACRWPLVLPSWHVLLADGQVGPAQAGHGASIHVYPPSGTFAAVLA